MADRRALSKNYKERRLVGGVYLIRNTENGRYILRHALDLAGAPNRFQFGVTTNVAVDVRVRADWATCGPHAFTFEENSNRAMTRPVPNSPTTSQRWQTMPRRS